jgi:hypothetical protein
VFAFRPPLPLPLSLSLSISLDLSLPSDVIPELAGGALAGLSDHGMENGARSACYRGNAI